MSITNSFNITHQLILKRQVIKTLYSSSKNKNTNILFSLRATDDGDILCTNFYNKKYLNYKNYITVAENEGKFSKNAIHFTGHKDQKILLDGNLFYNLTEFTISTWIKTLNFSINPTTLIEIVPKMLFNIKNDTSREIPKEVKLMINKFSTESNADNNSINVGVYKSDNIDEINIKHNTIYNFNKFYWNYISLIFKDSTFYLFVNGKLIKSNKITNDFTSINTGNYTVIGSSFIDDKSVANDVYIDDFIIFDKALFLSDFPIPNTFLHPNYNNGIKFDIQRVPQKLYNFKYDITRITGKNMEFNFDSSYSCTNKNSIVIFKFIF